MTDPFFDATALAAAIRAGRISPMEALEAAIARAETVNPALNFITQKLYDRARAKARQPRGKGPFAGVPYLIKDMQPMAGVVSGFASNCTRMAPPAEANSAYVQALEDAGLNTFALTTMGEFGYLPQTESTRHGISRNPWNTGHTPGGSSGGSAAAVAAGVCAMADAADGGGSIRIPAANCGLFGLKPSRGRNIGEYPTASGVDLVVMNPVSWTVRDTAGMMAATERKDATAKFAPMGLVSEPLKRRLKIGVHSSGLRGHLPDADVARVLADTVRLLETLGHHVEETQWPFDGEAFMAAFGAVWIKGAALTNQAIGAIATQTGQRIEDMLEPYTLSIGALGEQVDDAMLAQAKAGIEAFSRAYFAWFDSYDVTLCPVLLTPPLEVGKLNGTIDPLLASQLVERVADYTMVENATGGPAMSVPLGMSEDGLPIGMQFSAALGADALLLELAYELEQAAPWIGRRPQGWAF